MLKRKKLKLKIHQHQHKYSFHVKVHGAVSILPASLVISSHRETHRGAQVITIKEKSHREILHGGHMMTQRQTNSAY